MLQISVENLGKVQSAKLTPAPLMMLVGKNNTGKSYIASLLWSFSRLFDLFSIDQSNIRPMWFDEMARQAIDGPVEVHIDSEKARDIICHINECFRLKGASFLGEIFAYDSFKDTYINLDENCYFADFTVAAASSDMSFPAPTKDLVKRRQMVSFVIGVEDTIATRFRIPLIDMNYRESSIVRIYTEIVGRVLFGHDWQKYRNSCYIPAARTGLMLSLRALVSHSLDPGLDRPGQTLPRPLSDFLQVIADSSILNSKEERQTANWLEQNTIHGSISSTDSDIPDFEYIPYGVSQSIPLHATSSMITEVAPFLLVTRSGFGYRHLVFEEPEAHLHLEAQRNMARTIARLLNEGIYVTLTTHSDTFIQQINNLMRLFSHPQQDELMARFGYEAVDLIDPSMVATYEFCDVDGKTTVQKVEMSEEGFAIKTLNDTLISLAEETYALSETDD